MWLIDYLVFGYENCYKNGCLLKIVKDIMLTAISLAGTTVKARRLNIYFQKLMIVNYLLNNESYNIYLGHDELVSESIFLAILWGTYP